MTKQRRIEVFTAGCPLCDETLALVRRLACPSCQVTVHDLRTGGLDLAKQYGVNSVPAVVVDGSILDCCARRGPTEADLKAAGVGIPL